MEWRDPHPEGVAKNYKPQGGTSMYTREDILEIAELAWDSLLDKSVSWLELDASVQRNLFDTAEVILHKGAPSTAFELAVAEQKEVFDAVPPEARAKKVKAAAAKSEKEAAAAAKEAKEAEEHAKKK